MKRADRKKLSEPFKETCPLLVEGRDDLFVVAAIADKLGLPCNGAKRVGVWLMLNNKQVGMLEDLYQTFIPDADELAPLVNDSLNQVESLNLQCYKHRPKAFVHTWLAWQEDAGMPMGRSISDYNLVDTKTAEPFANWLRRLFPSEQTER